MSGNTILRAARTALARAAEFAAIVPLACWLMTGSCLAEPPTIERLSRVDASGKLVDGDAVVGLNEQLAVVLKSDPGTVIDSGKVVLFFDGRVIAGLKDTIYRSGDRALIFRLVRNIDNADGLQPFLASPGLMPRTIAVGLYLEKPPAATADKPTPQPIAGANQVQPTFKLVLIATGWLIAGAVAVVLVLVAVWAAASRTNILKDALLPQLAPKEQSFSLGRTQMAFWFTLVFASYVFLYLLLWDSNTLTGQSLILMGLSGATAIFSVAIDAAKDTPIGAANETLRAIGIDSYADVVKLEREIAERNAQLNSNPPPDAATTLKLRTEIFDRQVKLRSWREITRPFVTRGWYRDLMNDINGPALHRLQVIVWTLALGVVFLIDVYRTLAMPQFSEMQLALVGITSGAYLGFKFPEKQH